MKVDYPINSCEIIDIDPGKNTGLNIETNNNIIEDVFGNSQAKIAINDLKMYSTGIFDTDDMTLKEIEELKNYYKVITKQIIIKLISNSEYREELILALKSNVDFKCYENVYILNEWKNLLMFE